MTLIIYQIPFKATVCVYNDKKDSSSFFRFNKIKKNENYFLRIFLWGKSNEIVFVSPTDIDESVVNIQDIVMCLPEPTASQEYSRLSLTQFSGEFFANFNIR